MLEQIRTLHSRQAVVQLELIHIVGRVWAFTMCDYRIICNPWDPTFQKDF
jgi:hypothetical protein